MSQSVFAPDSLIWNNNTFVKYTDACYVHIAAHSMHYSSSIFEGIICLDGKVFELKRHISRFFNSAKIMGMIVNYSQEQLINATNAVIQKNNYTQGLYYIRPLAWRDVEDATIKGFQDPQANIAIMSRKHTNSLNKDVTPVRLLLSSWKKAPASCMPHQCKGAGNYLVPILAKQEARNKGLDDVLLLDTDGLIAEAGSANAFFVNSKSRELHTPTTAHCLNGITRQTIIQLAQNAGYNVVERNIIPSEIENFDELFLTGTAVGVLSVKSVTLSSQTTVEFSSFKVTSLLKDLYKKKVISF